MGAPLRTDALRGRPARSSEDEAAAIVPGLPRGARRCSFRSVGFIAANLIAFCRSKTVSKAVHAPPADGPCRKAGTVCVGVNLISADCTPGVSVAVSVRAYTLVADRTRRPAGAVAISADVPTQPVVLPYRSVWVFKV